MVIFNPVFAEFGVFTQSVPSAATWLRWHGIPACRGGVLG